MPIRRAAEAARLEPRNGAAVVILAAGPPAGLGTDDRPMRKLTTMNSVVGRVPAPHDAAAVCPCVNPQSTDSGGPGSTAKRCRWL